MKRVGIMTLYYKTYNYGAQLQAFALQKVVEKLGYDCEVIAFDWMNKQSKLFYQNVGGANAKVFEKFSLDIPHSEKVYNASDIYTANVDYDIFICGSDQIWGCENSMPVYNYFNMTLGFVDERKVKIGYGISMGGSKPIKRIGNALQHPAKNLDVVSVREQSAAEYISTITEKDIANVLDPTLLLPEDEWRNLIESSKSCEGYILVYMLRNNNEITQLASLIASKYNCKVKTISYSESEQTGPIDFINFVSGAKYVLTDSYHGTIFSIIFNKEFLSFHIDDIKTAHTKNTRQIDLLKKLDLLERLVNPEEDVVELYSNISGIDYGFVNEKIDSERILSLNFLKKSLKIRKENSETQTTDYFGKIIPEEIYLNTISELISEECLSYELMLLNAEQSLDDYVLNTYRQITAWKNYAKIEKAIRIGYDLTKNLQFKENIIIYGLGVVGKRLCECFEKKILCIIDIYSTESSYNNIPVCKFGDEKLSEIISKDEVSIIITPMWDYTNILKQFHEKYQSECNLVSINDLLKEINL